MVLNGKVVETYFHPVQRDKLWKEALPRLMQRQEEFAEIEKRNGWIEPRDIPNDAERVPCRSWVDRYERIHGTEETQRLIPSGLLETDEVCRSDAKRNLKQEKKLSLADADDAALRPYRNCERYLGIPSSSEAERIIQLACDVIDELESCIVDLDATRPSCLPDSSHRHER